MTATVIVAIIVIAAAVLMIFGDKEL